MGTCDHGLSHPFKGAGAVANGLTGIKMGWEVSLNFHLALNTLEFSRFPPIINLKNRSGENVATMQLTVPYLSIVIIGNTSCIEFLMFILIKSN